jgi:RNA polymerase sigma factor (sigma-70 family)
VTDLSPARSSPDITGKDRDATTVGLLAAGDNEGLKRLIADHGGRVRWTLRNEFDKVLDASDIDDALGQATVRVWKSRHRFDPTQGTLRAWFYVIARNCALRIVQSRRRDPKFLEDLDALPPVTQFHDDEPAENPKRDAFLRDLLRCIDRLPGLERAIMLADLAAGGSAETRLLVEEFHTTANSVYVSRAKARKKLRAALLALGHGMGKKPTAEAAEA